MTVDASLPSVLVADDDPGLRASLRALLEARAWVVEAADGERALQVLHEQGPDGVIDLVLLDDRLPGRSGLEVLGVARRRWPSLPVVILTDAGSEELAVQALRAGASDYLKKPLGLETLLRTVTALAPPVVEPPPSGRSPHGSLERADSRHPSIRRALGFIRRRFAEPITLAAVAREAGLSRFHFCRVFHQELGMPLHDYVHALRVGRAKILLADHRLRVSEVAYAVGFNDLSHFDRTFRRLVGRSPREYRASLRCA